ncbi:hypothetical protein F2P81_020791 [Scophthalmus maximus]|uniref:Uncharacterized protein n=1 Tax=Scophthalmus maximus TaxID=52904 RepID=A0A6A4S673_SCOMX|nr:hypothetical protein F2P81_020791 [Scophthalmus maximus]
MGTSVRRQTGGTKTRRGEDESPRPPCLYSPYPARTWQLPSDTQLVFPAVNVGSVRPQSSGVFLFLSLSLSHSLSPPGMLPAGQEWAVARMRSGSRDDVGTWKTVAWQFEKKKTPVDVHRV